MTAKYTGENDLNASFQTIPRYGTVEYSLQELILYKVAQPLIHDSRVRVSAKNVFSVIG